MQQTPATGAPKSLILMSSMYGLMPAYGVLADYSMSKHAVLSLSRSLAARYKKAGIKVASVHPWFSGACSLAGLLLCADVQARTDTVMVPDTLRRLLHGMPYTPITSVAGAVLHAATDPDVDRTAGCTYTLPDDGPVVREDYYTGSGLLAELFARMDALVPPSAPGPTAAGSAAA
jgi:NAD(P)-dependent dehydrogenase (short-subunit alcohol dehydrogenase family)